MPGTSNKKSLYEILGVKPEATLAEIHAAYESMTGAEASGAALDPARRMALHEAHAILANERRRVAYDESLRQRDLAPVAEVLEEVDEQSAGSKRKLLMAGAAIVLVFLVAWFMKPPGRAPQAPPANLAAPAAPAAEPAAPAVSPAEAAEAAEAAREKLLLGNWHCQGPLTGKGLDLGFASDGTYGGQSDGQPVRGYYKLAGATLTLNDSGQSNAFAVEELAQTRLVISRGEGRRLTCTR